MNSLQSIRDYSRKAVIALILISSLGLAAAAQRVDSQSQGRMYGEPGFTGEPINLKVVNADIRDILNYITEQYGVNFVIDSSVKDVPVTVNVNNVPWNVALDSVLRAQGLGIQVNGSILRVADAKTLAAEISVNRTIRDSQLDMAPLYTEFIRLNYARAEGKLQDVAGSAGQLASGTVLSKTLSDGNLNGDSGSAMSEAAAFGGPRFSSGSDEGILGIIQKRLSRRGSIEVDKRTNTLIVTDVRDNLDAVKQLISRLDQPEPQVEIETRIVVANRNFSRDIGVQLAAFLSGPRGSGVQGGTLPTPDTGGVVASPGLPLTNPKNSLLSSIPSTVIGLTTGVFGTAQLSALISAGEQKGQAKIIATPRVTTLNNRPAEIKSSTQIPITTIQPGAASGGALVTTTQYVDVPLRLGITPQITDLDTVILNVVAENSSTSTIVGGAAPAINTQSMKTEVTVPNGGTTVVGGVLFDDERESQDRTPGVSKIPLLGNLFKRKGILRNSNEILFFITPRIQRPENRTPVNASAQPTILQPVPLGNPPSNSTGKQPTVVTPGAAVVQTEPTSTTPPGKP